MKAVQIEFKGESNAPVYRCVTKLSFGAKWLSFCYKEDGDKQVWKTHFPVVAIHCVREWTE